MIGDESETGIKRHCRYSLARVMAAKVGLSRRALAYRMKRWPEHRWLEPASYNSLENRCGRRSKH